MIIRAYCKPLIGLLIYFVGTTTTSAADTFAADYSFYMQNFCSQHKYQLCFNFLQPMAASGHARSQDTIAYLYENGLGVRKSATAARRLYIESAMQGLATAQSKVADSYISGELGFTQNYSLGMYWAKKAAAQNDSWGLSLLSSIYQQGLGVEKNDREAANWMIRCALSADAFCQYRAAGIFWRGDGAEKDAVEALKWVIISIATYQNDPGNALNLKLLNMSKEFRDKISESLSDAQIVSAQQQAAQFSRN